MAIEVLDKSISDKFTSEKVVFIITANEENGGVRHNIDMVTTYDDYKEKLYAHEYTPLLYEVNLFTRLAYMYGCLNYEYNEPHTKTYTFWWRTIGENRWQKWFIVHPYREQP